ncbi:MAG: disulfide reductase, partial [Chloroflexi bacterium]|nr:disulfide reductase [Chloroflexota bacterium]
YIDIRSAGKRYEEFVQRAMEEDRVVYLRGKASRVFREGDKVVVWGVDTLAGRSVQISADLVVVAPAMIPQAGALELARCFGAAVDTLGFFCEADRNLDPVESGRAGVFLAGTAVGPKDIPETVAQASAAAGKVLALFSRWGAAEG